MWKGAGSMPTHMYAGSLEVHRGASVNSSGAEKAKLPLSSPLGPLPLSVKGRPTSAIVIPSPEVTIVTDWHGTFTPFCMGS